MGQMLATDQRLERLVSLHQRNFSELRRMWLDLCFRRAVGMGMLPLWTVVQGQLRMRLVLGARQGLGRVMGFMASRPRRIVLMHGMGTVTARGGVRVERWHQLVG